MPARCFSLSSLLLLAVVPACAGQSLLFLEAQAVGGYSSAAKEPVWHSMSAAGPMQKTSAGFDWLDKIAGEGGDTGTLALQARLAADPDARNRVEPQIYNAYYRRKFPSFYAWAGHDRPAAGLESYFDTHGALLQALPMYGYGYDRDWGCGLSRDLENGDAALSLTTGSGMRLRGAGGWLAPARVSRGVLARDNYTVGLYASRGRVPETDGYTLLDGAAKAYSADGADGALLWDRWELRGDVRAGRKSGARYLAGLARLGLNLLDENRLKLETQAVYSGLPKMEGWVLAAGASYSLSAELTCRAMFESDAVMHDRRIVGQLYYYLPI